MSYDMVDWIFLDYMLSRMHFCEKWTASICVYVSSVSFKIILIKKEVHTTYKPETKKNLCRCRYKSIYPMHKN